MKHFLQRLHVKKKLYVRQLVKEMIRCKVDTGARVGGVAKRKERSFSIVESANWPINICANCIYLLY